MEIPLIAAAFTSIKNAIDITNLIKDSNISLEKAEGKLKLAELISNLADVKIQVAEIQQVLLDKETQIRGLQEQVKVKEELKYEAPYYWRIDETGSKHGPFCQRCYDDNYKLFRLQGGRRGAWECKACKNYYYDSTYSSTIRIA